MLLEVLMMLDVGSRLGREGLDWCCSVVVVVIGFLVGWKVDESESSFILWLGWVVSWSLRIVSWDNSWDWLRQRVLRLNSQFLRQIYDFVSEPNLFAETTPETKVVIWSLRGKIWLRFERNSFQILTRSVCFSLMNTNEIIAIWRGQLIKLTHLLKKQQFA